MSEKETTPAATPRWVKVFGIIALILVVLVVLMLVMGRGGHGPGRHTSANQAPRHIGEGPPVTARSEPRP